MSSLLALVLVLASSRTPDAPKPPSPTAVVDFAPVFDGGGVSYSVYTRAPEAGMMERVLLSPNLVFEASRSSLDEPKTVGGIAAPGAGPSESYAVGNVVDVRSSSILLDYLQSKGSVLIAPAVTRRWSWEWWCGGKDDYCPKTTWVERLLLMRQRIARPDDARPGPVAPDDALRAAPTSMLAVRDLGQAGQRVYVVVQQEGDRLVVKRATKRGEPNLCPGLTIDMPMTTFSAEVLSMTDGRIVARIHEARLPKLTGDFRVKITRAVHEPVKATQEIPGKKAPCGFLGIGADEPPTYHEYVASWTAVDTTCPQVQGAFKVLGESLEDQLGSPDVIREVLRGTLDGLYR